MINALYFSNSSTGFAVGDSGVILKTINGGDTWQDISYSGTYRTIINDVFFVNPDTGFVVADVGIGNFVLNSLVLRTFNGGATWDSVFGMAIDNGMAARFTACSFFNDGTGFIAGAEGDNRQSQFQYALGSGVMYKTTDFGLTWRRISILLNFSSFRDFWYIQDLSFPAPSLGFAAGTCTYPTAPFSRGVIVKTVNGGDTWTLDLDTSAAAGIPPLWTIHFPSPNAGYAGGEQGTILKYGSGVWISPHRRSNGGFGISRNGYLRYDLQVPAKVKVLLYDLRGRQTIRLLDGELGAGKHTLRFPDRSSPAIIDFRADERRKTEMIGR